LSEPSRSRFIFAQAWLDRPKFGKFASPSLLRIAEALDQ